MTDWLPFVLGVGGGAAFDFLPLYSSRWGKVRPPWIKSWFFWMTGIAMWVIGGVLAWFYHQQLQLPETNVLLAVHVGASAPLILNKLAARGLSETG